MSTMSKLKHYFKSRPIVKYAKGDTIVLANTDPKGVLYLVEGIVEQYDITPEGNKVSVNVFKPGSFFPMSWAINQTKNTYFYGALTDVKLKIADPERTVAFLLQNPDVLLDLMSRVYKGTDALLKRLVLASRGDASNRLIYELLIEAYRFGDNTSNNSEKSIKIKGSALAERSGLARETVSRKLHELDQDGLIKLSGQKITLDIDMLEKKLNLDA